MTKREAIELMGGTGADLARALGITPSAVYQWAEELSQEQADRVRGAALRLGRLHAWRVRPGYGEAASQTSEAA